METLGMIGIIFVIAHTRIEYSYFTQLCIADTCMGLALVYSRLS